LDENQKPQYNEEEELAHLEAIAEYYRRKLTEIQKRIEDIRYGNDAGSSKKP
jgi:hypothetical protein